MSSWFVALSVPAGPWFTALPDPPAATRRGVATDLHLTVAFLGAAGETRSRKAFEAARDADLGAFAVELGPVEAMGTRDRFSALAAVVRGADARGIAIETALAPARDAALAAADCPAEARTMRPHVTLARVRRRATRAERASARAWAKDLALGDVRLRLDALALYTASAPEDDGVYRIVERATLPG